MYDKNIENMDSQTLSLTDAVLKEYDKGNTTAPLILSNLMCSFPLLSLATINRIIKEHRKKRTEKKEEKPRPKTEIELAEEGISKKCQSCPLYQEGRPCVMPMGLCAYPEVNEEMLRLKKLIDEKKARRGEIKVPGGKIIYIKKNRPRVDPFEEFERALDDFQEEKELEAELRAHPVYSPGRFESSVMESAYFAPDAEKEKIGLAKDMEPTLEDFADILAPSINPLANRDDYGFGTNDDEKLLDKFDSYIDFKNKRKKNNMDDDFDLLSQDDVEAEFDRFEELLDNIFDDDDDDNDAIIEESAADGNDSNEDEEPVDDDFSDFENELDNLADESDSDEDEKIDIDFDRFEDMLDEYY